MGRKGYSDRTGLGGKPTDYRHPAEEAAFRDALREQSKARNRAKGLKTPKRIIARPVQLPPIVNIKDGEEPPEWEPSS